jgi:hypothetical protein
MSKVVWAMLRIVGVPSRKTGASAVVVANGDITIEVSWFANWLRSSNTMYTLYAVPISSPVTAYVKTLPTVIMSTDPEMIIPAPLDPLPLRTCTTVGGTLFSIEQDPYSHERF